MNKFSVWIAALLLAASIPAQAGEAAGKVSYMSGTLVAQRTDGTLMVLGPKSEVREGDLLITAKDSYAQVQMNDGARVTLRPHSNLKIEQFHFNKENPQADNAVLRLIKGGFRALTGLIGKRGNPDAYKVRAATATIGIRGTEFTSRLCTAKDCKDDETAGAARQVVKPPIPQQQVIGRVMLTSGELSAKETDGKARKLVIGAPIYEGDALSTGAGYAIVAFRDESRVTLQPNTVFQVEQFKFDRAAEQENAVLRLLKGGVRVITGLIGRINRDKYQFRVATATIGIRGTGFDAWCNGLCASGADNPGATQEKPLDGAGVFVWDGEVALVSPGGSFLVAIGQAAIIARDSGQPVSIIAIPASVIENNAPFPNSIPLDMEKLFGEEASAGEPGLYVMVHDGHVILARGDEKLDLGRGETGFADSEALRRLAVPPAFLSGDMQIGAETGNQNSNPSMNPTGCMIAP
ncbi:MAG: FecR domain-containing protein [Nitrosomonadales bacterium]|nr:FecR domain-containing protein [Nitrosomonadales bacterium]